MTDLTNYVLEDRTCKCGCAETFKVLSTSKQDFASQKCEHWFSKFGKIEKPKHKLSQSDLAELNKLHKLFKGEGRD